MIVKMKKITLLCVEKERATAMEQLRELGIVHVDHESRVESDNVEAIRQGLSMILNEFNKAFDDLGVKRVDSVGKPFDPDRQEAVLQEASETVPEGVVIKEWSPAYMLGDRCIRAAKVVVSTGKPAQPEAEQETPEKA